MNRMLRLSVWALVLAGVSGGRGAWAGDREKSKARCDHAGVCLRNDGERRDASGRTQFICFKSGKLVKVRCDLSGEGGNVSVGTWAHYGANEGIDFAAEENHGNAGFMVCSLE